VGCGDPDVYETSPHNYWYCMKLILPDRTTRTLDRPPATLESLLLAEGINPLEVIASRNGILLTEDTLIGANDEIRLLRIAHGG